MQGMKMGVAFLMAVGAAVVGLFAKDYVKSQGWV